MALESGVVPEDWRSAVFVPLNKGKGERTKCKNYRIMKHGWKNICGNISGQRP